MASCFPFDSISTHGKAINLIKFHFRKNITKYWLHRHMVMVAELENCRKIEKEIQFWRSGEHSKLRFFLGDVPGEKSCPVATRSN